MERQINQQLQEARDAYVQAKEHLDQLVQQHREATHQFGDSFLKSGRSKDQSRHNMLQLGEAMEDQGKIVAQLLSAYQARLRVHQTTGSGLSSVRIRNFEHFEADESLVGERCVVCLDDLKVGTQMVRLDCHCNHYLCKVCADTWFKDQNSCPTCRGTFK